MDNEPLCGYKELYEHVKGRMVPGKMNYIFLDEIQHVAHYEKAVDSLFVQKNTDVYITGSNAYFMSGELATLLSGRYVELKMLPLSFAEYVSAFPDSRSKEELYRDYIYNGGFPAPPDASDHLDDLLLFPFNQKVQVFRSLDQAQYAWEGIDTSKSKQPHTKQRRDPSDAGLRRCFCNFKGNVNLCA